MKKIIISIFLICIAIFAVSCNEKIEEVEPEVNKTDEVLKYINNLQSYNAKVKVTYFNDEPVEFEMIQDATKEGKYKIEIVQPDGLVGNISYNDGESIYQVNQNRSSKIYTSANDYPERVEILLTSFINNYVEKTKEFSKIGEHNNGEFIILEGVIDGSNTFFAKEQLVLDANTYTPIKLDIYNANGEKSVEVEYLEFNYNTTFEENYFTPIQK